MGELSSSPPHAVLHLPLSTAAHARPSTSPAPFVPFPPQSFKILKENMLVAEIRHPMTAVRRPQRDGPAAKFSVTRLLSLLLS